MSDSSYGSVMVEGVVYIDEREIARRDAEIERLRGELDALQTHFDIKTKMGAEKDAEIERLRRIIRDVVRSSWPPPPSWYAEAQEAAMLESGEFVSSGMVIKDDDDGAA